MNLRVFKQTKTDDEKLTFEELLWVTENNVDTGRSTDCVYFPTP